MPSRTLIEGLTPLLPPWWQWPTVLSLDAPIVAVLWQHLLAQTYGVMLRPAGRWSLALTVWAIYLADRIADVSLAPGVADRIPHRYYLRYRRAALTLLSIVIAADLLVAIFWLRPQVFANGLWLGLAVLIYLSAFSSNPALTNCKPFLAALLFTCGVFLIAWTATDYPPVSFAWPALSFFTVCLCNILLIGRWEERRSTRTTALFCIVLAILMMAVHPTKWQLAAMASLLGLSTLALLTGRLSPDARRVLADAVLLTPAFWI